MAAMDLEAIITFLDHSPAVRLLRADSAAYVLSFLQTAFKNGGSEAATALEHDELKQRLQQFQERLREEQHEALSGAPDRYLREWSDAGWLRRFLSAESSTSNYQLTRFAEDALRFVDAALTRQHRMVGTESRLRLVIDTLTDMVRGASADPDRRLHTLIEQREQLDREIEAIRSGQPVVTYHPAQIRERFQTAVELLKTLQSDFRAVEDRFEEIAREVTRQTTRVDHRRGEILAAALDAEDLIKQQDEGVSFNAFVAFLFSPQAQTRLRETIGEVVRLDAIAADRGAIDHLRGMVPSLLSEADNVLRQTGRLSQTLRRLLDDQASGHRRRTAEVLHEIRTLAARLKHSVEETGQPPPEPLALRVETSIGISSSFARPFWATPPIFDSEPETHRVDLETVRREARKLANLKRLNWEAMRAAITTATTQSGSLRLSELIKQHPPRVGVIELVGWLQIAHEDGHSIDRQATEELTLITSDALTGRSSMLRVRVPLVIFHQTQNQHAEPLRRKKPR